jgi:hypothetical protein
MTTFIFNSPTSAQQIPVITGSIVSDSNLPGYVLPLDVNLLTNQPILPPIDYTNLDFSSIKLQLINLLKANASLYGYNLRDFADSNTAGMLLNVVSYCGQMLSYHADSMVNQLFLDTSTNNWSTFRLLSLFGYKPTRPQPGVILLSVVRTASTNADPTQAALEDASEINFSSSTSRNRMALGNETYEIFPTKLLSGNLVPDLFGDFIIPPYIASADPNDNDLDLTTVEQNLYFCFGLTGVTVTENYISTGSANQAVALGQSPVLNSQVIVQVESNNTSNIAGSIAYDVWNELSYLSLAGFRTATRIGTALDGETPYLISSFKLAPTEYALKQQGQLQVGTILELDYNNILHIGNFNDFSDLLVPYMVGILVNIQSQKYSDDTYVDILLYHPSYVYGSSANTVSTYGLQSTLVNYVYSTEGEQVYWAAGDILYLLSNKLISSSISGNIYQPQLISDTQLRLANPSLYPDIVYFNNNPGALIAIGKALSANTMAVGISSNYDTYIESDTIYEVDTDGNFASTVMFGDGVFGQIPFNGANIAITYRVDDSRTTGNVINAGNASTTVTVGTVNLYITNNYDSAPPIAGESSDTAKVLVSRYFASQDRAVTGTDYTILVKKYNSNIKVTTALSKADSDSSVVRLYTLEVTSSSTLVQLQPLSFIEKLQLSEYINNYKCLGASIEIVDGLIRPINLRIDVTIKPGYLAGQVKSDLQSAVLAYFDLNTAEMGVGFSTAEFHNQLSQVSGIYDYNVYFSGIETITLSDGTIIPLGTQIYAQIQDIPSYNSSTNQFPAIGNPIVGIANLTTPMNPFEILVLDTCLINTSTLQGR